MPLQLRGANALLTGASYGLGPRLARALAERGVNLALTARSADKLDAVAHALAPLGVKVAAIAADVSQADDRGRLVSQAESALGPLDLLINNAGVEINRAFARLPAAAIEQTLATNTAAPLLLTRLVLPGMLTRRRGHIVNMASVAGKIPVPYGSVYGASKAALLSWSLALRAELEGTGVSVSAIAPGLVTEAGVFAVHQTQPHPLLGAIPPAAVVRGVLRALERDEPEVVIDPRTIWLFQLGVILSPRLVLTLNRWLGLKAWLRRTYDGT